MNQDQNQEPLQGLTNETAPFQPPQPPQVTSDQFPSLSTQLPAAPVKKSKKGLIIGIILGSVVLIAAISSILVYSLVYNNPENAVADAFSKVLAAKSGSVDGTMSIKSSGMSEMSAKVDMKSALNESDQASAELSLTATVSGKEYNLKGHFAGTKDEFYVKLDDVRSLIKDSLGSEYATMIDSYYGTLLDKIDSKWIVIKQSDITKTNDTESKCVETQVTKVRNDATLRNELIDVYKKNPLFTVESKGGDKDGNHYVLTPVDDQKAKEFRVALAETKFIKSVDDCVSSDVKKSLTSDVESSSSATDTKGSLELWIDGWSHNVNKITLNVKSGATDTKVELNTKFNNNPSVTIPKGETNFNDLKTEIEKIQSQLQTSTSTQTPVNYNESLYY